jgi:hypothetical protein
MSSTLPYLYQPVVRFHLNKFLMLVYFSMAAPLPESSFERMTAEAREKERLERQKMIVSLTSS